MRNEIVHILDFYEPVPVDLRHLAVDLGYDQWSHLDGGLDDVDGNPQAHVTVPIGRRGLDQGDVDGRDLPSEEVWNLGEEYRRVVSSSPVDGISCAVPDEEGVEPEVILELLVGVRGDPQAPDVDHLRLEEGLGVALDVIDERVEQVLGLTASGAYEYPVSRVDVPEYRAEGGELLRPHLPLPLITQAARVLFHLKIPIILQRTSSIRLVDLPFHLESFRCPTSQVERCFHLKGVRHR